MENYSRLPEFPTRSALDKKAARYAANYEAHLAGAHTNAPVRSGCKLCNQAKSSRRA